MHKQTHAQTRAVTAVADELAHPDCYDHLRLATQSNLDGRWGAEKVMVKGGQDVWRGLRGWRPEKVEAFEKRAEVSVKTLHGFKDIVVFLKGLE